MELIIVAILIHFSVHLIAMVIQVVCKFYMF